MNEIENNVLKKATQWLEGNYDPTTKEVIKELLSREDKTELIDSFYQDLEFGTGGLRGIMGVGSNRMNKYTVGMATQGLANYLNTSFCKKPVKVAIAYDSRNNSPYFADIAASILTANGIFVYIFDELRPTPELSFAIRHLGCQSGIVITASHNPKEYNGYKVYWEDGAQLVPPHDINVIKEVQKITSIEEIKTTKDPELITVIGEYIDEAYLKEIKNLSLSPESITAEHNISIVYTPIHGTGYKLIPRVLNKMGFTNISTVEEQMTPNGDFPTVKSPNPEESAALSLAIDKAKSVNAELIMATDPDADRVGIAIKKDNNEYILLNGNQTGALLIHYILLQWKEKNKLTGNEFIVKTIVTSEMIKAIADTYKVKSYNVLTGFKYIAEIIRENEGKMQYIAGGEESYGYLIGDFVRDKDAVSACTMIAEMAAWAKNNGLTLYDLLIDMYIQHGYYKEGLHSITKKGKSGADEIKEMMNNFRSNPPKKLTNSPVIKFIDYLNQTEMDLKCGVTNKLTLPKSNVLQLHTEDGTVVTMRPSGTEPKIKFYFGVKAPLLNKNDFHKTTEELENKIKNIIAELNLNS